MAYDENSAFIQELNEVADGLDKAENNFPTAVQELLDLSTDDADVNAEELQELNDRFEELWGDFNTFYLRVTGAED